MSSAASSSSSSSIVWELHQNVEPNPEYQRIKENLTCVIKQCHDLLYSNNAITGVKAQNDIMKLLTLVILGYQYKRGDPHLLSRCEWVRKEHDLDDEEYQIFCFHLTNLGSIAEHNGDDPFGEWQTFNNRFLVHMLPSIYTGDDSKFNCSDDRTFLQLIKILSQLEITDHFIDAFSTAGGDIHEMFQAYRGKGGKELGQFFTTRTLIHAILNGLGLLSVVKDALTQGHNPSVYDPCMGTGGFLSRVFKLCPMPAENLFGCEIESDTIKWAEINLLLTTKSTTYDLEHCNSLCENPFLLNNKFDVIVTNPPFGTKLKYAELKEKFDLFSSGNNPNHVIFEQIYPIKTNNGACLFVQHCAYMLNPGGICAIVLPDGELFSGSAIWIKKFQKWLCENFNVQTILRVPSGVFEYASISTNVIVFQKGNPTTQIHFVQTNVECTQITDLQTFPIEMIRKHNYSLNNGDYVEQKQLNYDVPVIELGQICDFQNGKGLSRKDFKEGIYQVIGAGHDPVGYHSEYNREPNTILCSSSGAYAGYISRYNNQVWASDCFSIRPKSMIQLDNNYLFYLLKANQDKIYKLQSGMAQPHVYSKDLSTLLIPMPLLEVQQQIVTELGSIEESITTIQTRILQLEKEKSWFTRIGIEDEIQHLLKNSSMMTLRDVCEINYGKGDYTGEGPYPLYGGGVKPSKYVNAYNVEPETTIISRSGSAGAVLKTDCRSLVSSYGYWIKVNSNILNDYLYCYLKLHQNQLSELKTGSTIKNVNRELLYTYLIHLPSFENQKCYVELFQKNEQFMKDLDDKIESEKLYIDELKKLSQKVIQFYCSQPQSVTEPIMLPQSSSPPIVVPKRKIIIKLK